MDSFLQMDGMHRFFRYDDDTIRLVYYPDLSSDSCFLGFFDMTVKMFEAIKTPFVEEMFRKWTSGGELDGKDPRICYMGNNKKGDDVYRIAPPVENHFVYFARGDRRGNLYTRIYLEEVLVYTGEIIEDKIDVTSFGRLMSVKSIDDLPLYGGGFRGASRMDPPAATN